MVLIDRRYKFVAYENGDRELTDMENDPSEQMNISSAASTLVRDYTQKLLQELLTSGSRFPPQVGHA
jgi:hypothetical protein